MTIEKYIKSAPLSNIDLTQLDKISKQSGFGTFRFVYINTLLIARIKNKIVGYLIYNIERKSLHIMELAVKKSYRGRGTGRELMSITKQDMKTLKLKKIVLETDSNFGSVDFYKKIGFRVLNHVPLHSDTYDYYCLEYP